eukprot:SAG31_NODE_1414_length_8451_cov_13.707016_2_plen_155_part_00
MQGMCSALWILFDGKWRVGEKERVSDLLAMVLTNSRRRLEELLATVGGWGRMFWRGSRHLRVWPLQGDLSHTSAATASTPVTDTTTPAARAPCELTAAAWGRVHAHVSYARRRALAVSVLIQYEMGARSPPFPTTAVADCHIDLLLLLRARTQQ